MAQTEVYGDREFIDASQLGWPPGVWPDTYNLEGIPLHRIGQRHTPDGELVSITYASTDGETVLEVLND